MFGKKKKKSLGKRLVTGAGATVLVSYIGKQMTDTINRNNIDKEVFDSEHYHFSNTEPLQNIREKSQRYYVFEISEGKEVKGKVKVLMGQEPESYYTGHIHLEGNFNDTHKREIYDRIIELYKDNMMDHAYFVCDFKDEEKKAFYESLGAKFRKKIVLTDQSVYYTTRKEAEKAQYILDLVPEAVRNRMNKKQESVKEF